MESLSLARCLHSPERFLEGVDFAIRVGGGVAFPATAPTSPGSSLSPGGHLRHATSSAHQKWQKWGETAGVAVEGGRQLCDVSPAHGCFGLAFH